ncbi:MAG: TRAP transporter permease [Chloroflexota bacterium]
MADYETKGSVPQQEVDELIEQFEAEARKRELSRWARPAVAALAIGSSLYALYASVSTVIAQQYRAVFLAVALVLTFLIYPMAARWRKGLSPIDIVLAVVGAVAVGYILVDFEEFIYRSTSPTTLDLIMGTITILLVLEATRRTTGPILPICAVIFIAYAYVGALLPPPWSHRGYDLDRLIGHNYMTLEGIFSTPLDVAATFIILFTIYGAFLEHSGAGKFFLDFSFAAMGRRPAGAGRTVTLASFLLGTVSGSGVATTVTVGAVAWPMLKKAGYDPESGGAVLSAGGIGAILSPPVLGAAAFLIAEFLKISYLDVIIMASVPTILYYLAIFLMIELDARRMGTKEVAVESPGVGWLIKRYGYHCTSLFTVVILMVVGFTPMLAVFWSIVVAFLLSFIRRDTALGPRRLAKALEGGATGVLSVAATCATAGIIVGVVTLTGLGLKFSGLIVGLAGGNLLLTVIWSAIAVWILGLAVPVTASYIIAAVMISPALTLLGVPDFAAHMFIFYYAVLSEVSPPTALSPFAAAAITGANPFKTMMVTWKYTLPAFIVPFMFTLSHEGIGLLLKGDPGNAIWVTGTACVGIVALVTGIGGWLFRRATPLERGLLVVAGLVLMYPGFADLFGLAFAGIAVVIQLYRVRRERHLAKGLAGSRDGRL